MATPITVAYGDGIGPEIMEATLHILREAGADITVETIEVGERIYNMGGTSGILPSAWDTLRRNKILLKGPTAAPRDNEYRDVTVAITETLNVAAPDDAGEPFALFEAGHDCTLPDMIRAAMAMLNHIGQSPVAMKIDNALRGVIENAVSETETGEFTEALIGRMHKMSDKQKQEVYVAS